MFVRVPMVGVVRQRLNKTRSQSSLVVQVRLLVLKWVMCWCWYGSRVDCMAALVGQSSELLYSEPYLVASLLLVVGREYLCPSDMDLVGMSAVC